MKFEVVTELSIEYIYNSRNLLMKFEDFVKHFPQQSTTVEIY